MPKISTGIRSINNLIDSLHIGDNIVWEVDAGTSYDVFVQSFIRQSFDDSQKVIYVSFNKSPQSTLNAMNNLLNPEHFILIDCFTSGKGKNDNTFLRFYENPQNIKIIRINNPKDINQFTQTLNSLEDSFPPGARYVFDSLTGMQDLWGDENDTYKFFTYMCPRLYDLDTVAYWILEKEAHSQKFKANLRHITQAVLELYKRREMLYIKALKLEDRQDREAFKPHLYEIKDRDVTITFPRKEPSPDIGSKLKQTRIKLGMSQKELADKVELTPSFISQLENNQISPSLNSFMQICNALGVSPSLLLEDKKINEVNWLIKKKKIFSRPLIKEEGLKVFNITGNGKLSANVAVIEPNTKIKKHLLFHKGEELIYVLNGSVSVVIDEREETLNAGDSVHLKEETPSLWKNEGSNDVELLVICL
jgi:transcriptional regulator with XRE-family HTH domain